MNIDVFNDKNHLMMHLLITMLIVVFIACIRFDVNPIKTILVKEKEIVYLDPVDTAFAVEKISNYTDNLNENLPVLEESLFFSQKRTAEYLDKDLAKNNFNTQKTTLEREYVIQDGDTISGIAEKFEMHIGTIYDRNNLSADNIENLRPGDTIIIPAYDQTNSQRWLAELNDKKEQERQRLLALEQEQTRQQQLAAATRYVYTRDTVDYSGTNTTTANYSDANGYPYGWCTYYAASQRSVPSSWGNAGSWLYSAQTDGYSTGSAPAAGAIIVTGESWYGHVGIVNSVNSDGSVNISEMNYDGWGVVNSRTISAGSPVVKGYIY